MIESPQTNRLVTPTDYNNLRSNFNNSLRRSDQGETAKSANNITDCLRAGPSSNNTRLSENDRLIEAKGGAIRKHSFSNSISPFVQTPSKEHLQPSIENLPEYKMLYSFQTKTPKDKARCHPWSFILTRERHLVVPDTYNSKLKVFEESGVFVKEITHRLLKSPKALCLTHGGDYAVSDGRDNDIKIFTPDGELAGISMKFKSISSKYS